MSKEKSYVSIDEMIEVAENQINRLKDLKQYDELNNQELFKRRIEIREKLENILSYKKDKEGYAIISSTHDAINPIRDRLNKATIDVIKTTIEESVDLELEYNLSNRSRLQILGPASEPSYNKVLMATILLSTNEYQVYEPENMENMEDFRIKRIKEYESNISKIEEEVRQLEESFSCLDCIVVKAQNLIRGNTKSLKRIEEEIKNKKELIKDLKDRIKKEYKNFEIKKNTISYQNKVNEIIRSLGFIENNNEYFAYE